MDGFSTTNEGGGRVRGHRLAAMLADPVVQAVMACDGVSEEDLAGALASARAALAPSGPGAPTARHFEPEPRSAQWKL